MSDCPICRRPVTAEPRAHPDMGAPQASTFPFCSARCKLVDLGAWLDGSYRISGESIAEPDDQVLAQLTSRDGGDA